MQNTSSNKSAWKKALTTVALVKVITLIPSMPEWAVSGIAKTLMMKNGISIYISIATIMMVIWSLKFLPEALNNFVWATIITLLVGNAIIKGVKNNKQNK